VLKQNHIKQDLIVQGCW